MFSLTRSVRINRPGDRSQLTRDQVWKGLMMKVRDGRAFVPNMTHCQVVSEEQGALVRELAMTNVPLFRERVTIHGDKLVVFEHVMPSRPNVVLNYLETDEAGELCLRYTFLLEFPDLSHGSEAEQARQRELGATLPKSVDATLDTMHRMAENGQL
jgi:hypothetical protein